MRRSNAKETMDRPLTVLRHDSLSRDMIEGRMEEKRPRGRKRMMMLDDIKDGRSYYKTKRQAEERKLLRGT